MNSTHRQGMPHIFAILSTFCKVGMFVLNKYLLCGIQKETEFYIYDFDEDNWFSNL